MSNTRYVQHKSGVGETWKALEDRYDDVWQVERRGHVYNLWLPKSEYLEVAAPEPPKVWTDVTAELSASGFLDLLKRNGHVSLYGLHTLTLDGGYRLRKARLCRVEGDPLNLSSYNYQQAFILEKETQDSAHLNDQDAPTFVTGDRVMVYNRYLFAVPVLATVDGISTSDGALRLVFDDGQHGLDNVTARNGSYFFPEECRKVQP